MGFKIDINTQEILRKRGLNENGPAQILFTKECAKAMNNYVPFLTGRLKDMTVELGTDFVAYKAPYAKRQYYTNKGNGNQGVNQGGLRGKQWDKRMWPQQKDGILKTVADSVGGRTE
ncbi:minor capsid protein [uncultured Clostridium sp.]|uniref:minor capsid protein n=1 Tax=uncultured Clostridium sp. TaxID=59620 RepID=UPI0028EC85D8|nr:minor capsid protein [uncultured Clostridium sp.]